MIIFPVLILFGCITQYLAEATSPYTEVSLGTTLVAVTFRDGVVVGADTRTSVGTYVSNRYADKIAPILSNVVIARSGSAADTQHLANQARIEFQARRYRFGTMTTSVRQIAFFLRSLITDSMSAGLICAGYEEGRGCIYSIAPNGSIEKEVDGFAVGGSGSTYILGHIDENFRMDMTEEEATEFVVRALRLAMDRDGSSGGFSRIHVVDAKGSKVFSFFPENPNMDSNREVTLKGFAPSKRDFNK
jgi:20S proteasome subunit beta 1